MDLIEELRREERYLSTREVMGLLKIRRTTLCQWVRQGKLTAVRTGNRYLYDPRKLADWLSARQTGAAPAPRIA
jgi:excisionase family DNA binding protein